MSGFFQNVGMYMWWLLYVSLPLQIHNNTVLNQNVKKKVGINDIIADNVVRMKVKYNTPIRKRLPESMIIEKIKSGYKTLSAILDTHLQIISTRTKRKNDFSFQIIQKG